MNRTARDAVPPNMPIPWDAAMPGYRVLARLELAPADNGGLVQPLPAGTRSLLLRFPAAGDDSSEPVTLGAVVTPRGAAELVPGQVTDADVLFWADEARVHATPGTSFELWYGRPVGRGAVTGVADRVRLPREGTWRPATGTGTL